MSINSIEVVNGEKLAGMDKAKGTREQLKGKDSSGGNIVLPPEEEAPTLTEIGITKRQSADWQNIAAIDAAEFEAALQSEKKLNTENMANAPKPRNK